MWSINSLSSAGKDKPSVGFEDRNFQRLDENCNIERSYSSSRERDVFSVTAVPLLLNENETPCFMMDVHLKDRRNDVQVVPDFSDLLKTITDDTSEKTQLPNTEYELPTSTEGLFPRNYRAIDNENAPRRHSERDELGIYLNENLLTPQPVERLFSTLDTEPSDVFCFSSPPEIEHEKTQRNSDLVTCTSVVSTPDISTDGRLVLNSLHNGCQTSEGEMGPQKQEPLDSFPACKVNVSANTMEINAFTHQSVRLAQEQSGEDINDNNNIASWNNETQTSPNKLKLTVYIGQDINSFTLHGSKRQTCQGNEGRATCLFPANTASWEYGTSTVFSSSLMDDVMDQSHKGRKNRLQQLDPVDWQRQAPEKNTPEMEHSREVLHSEIYRSLPIDVLQTSSSFPSHFQAENRAFDQVKYLDESTKSEFGCVLKHTQEKPDRTMYWNEFDGTSATVIPRKLEKIRPGLGVSESGHLCGLFPEHSEDFPPKVLTPAPPSPGRALNFPPLLGNQTNTRSVEEGFDLKKPEFAGCKQTGGEENLIKQEDHPIQRFCADFFAENFNSQDNIPPAWLRGNDVAVAKDRHGQRKKQQTATANSESSENSGLTSQEAAQLTIDKSTNNNNTKVLRNVHNNSEKQRRHSMRNRLENLRRAIPELMWKPRAPKILILTKARGYIDDLTNEGTHLEKVIMEEKKRNRFLLEKLQEVMTHWKPAS